VTKVHFDSLLAELVRHDHNEVDIIDLSIITVDTKANILASSATTPAVAFASDTLKFYIADGSAWRVVDLPMLPSGYDMGAETDSPRTGYHPDWISDKTLSNIALGGSSSTINGGLRVDVVNDPDTLEAYLRGAWQTIMYDLTVDDGDFRHTPLSEEIYIWRGDSVTVGLNGRSLISEYRVSMGAYPPPRTLYGGTF
jgi:hypothetical protein